MTTPGLNRRVIGATVAASVSTAALLGGLLWVQHERSGWPFGTVAQPAASATARTVTTAAPGPDRVAVDVAGTVRESLGVRLDTVGRSSVSTDVRAVAVVVADESRITHVHTRVSGWLETLDVRTTGELVTAGQAVAGIFSQEQFASQVEYLAARRTTVASGLSSAVVASGRTRLSVIGMTDAEIDAIEQSGQPRRLVTVVAPSSGVVINRGVTEGMAVDPSTTLLTIADLSRVWILAEVPEANIPDMRVGATALVDVPASGRPAFNARVEFIYPTLTETTRTLRVRLSVANPGGRLKPGMYGTATFRSAGRTVVTVPREAVVDTGARQHVFVVDGDRFDPRPVTLGVRLNDRVEVLAGLAGGERIVASGVFLIDSESRLRASGGMGSHNHGGAPTGGATDAAPGTPTAPAPAPTGAGVDEHAGHDHRPVAVPTPDATAPSATAPTPASPPPPAAPMDHSGH